MKIAVTGANGYLGSAIASYLDAYHEVIRIVRSSPPSSDYLQLNDLFELESRHLSEVDSLIHCAGVASANADEESLRKVNVELSGHVAKVCSESRVSSFFYLSSVKACGEGNVGPDVTDVPETRYGQSKLKGENKIVETLSGTETQFQSIRLPLMYSFEAINNFSRLVSLARSSLPLPVNALNANRSYCSVQNLLGYLDRALTKESLQPIAYVADRLPVALADLLDELARAQGKQITGIPFPRGLLKAILSKLYPKLSNQLFEDSVVNITETLEEMKGWLPMETSEYIQKEFGRDGRI